MHATITVLATALLPMHPPVGDTLVHGLQVAMAEERYEVDGRTIHEAMEAIRRNAPEATGRSNAHGLTTYRLAARWSFLPLQPGCALDRVAVEEAGLLLGRLASLRASHCNALHGRAERMVDERSELLRARQAELDGNR